MVNFQFFSSHFPVTTLGLDMFSGTYLNKLLFCGAPWFRKTQSRGSTRCFIAWLNWNTAGFWKLCFFKKIMWWSKSQKRCQLISVMQSSFIWISWPLKMGLINCPRTSVRNYYSLVCDSSEEHRFLLTIWRCGSGFGPVWSRSEQSGLVQSSSVLCVQIYMTSHI